MAKLKNISSSPSIQGTSVLMWTGNIQLQSLTTNASCAHYSDCDDRQLRRETVQSECYVTLQLLFSSSKLNGFLPTSDTISDANTS
jgi:hypothetical protein